MEHRRITLARTSHSEPDHAAGRQLRVVRKIFGAHGRSVERCDRGNAIRLRRDRLDALRERHVIVHRWVAALDGQRVRRAMRVADPARDPFDAFWDVGPHALVQTSYRAGYPRGIGDDVAAVAPFDLTYGHHDRLERVDLAARDPLKRPHELRCDRYRIHRGVRVAAVAAATADLEIEIVARRHSRT